jgi:hypothetical protein
LQTTHKHLGHIIYWQSTIKSSLARQSSAPLCDKRSFPLYQENHSLWQSGAKEGKRTLRLRFSEISCK